MSWIDEIAKKFTKSDSSKHEIPEGVWTKCEKCEQVLYRSELERNLNVCPKCGHHMRLKARARLDCFLDQNEREELGAELAPSDVLRFKDLKRYKDRFAAAQKSTGEKDALVVEKGSLKGIPVVACAFEFSFMGGSMGSVVGARFCLAAETCLREKRALICFSTSGGARMQESLLSLMQMAKTSAVLAQLSAAHLPFISVMSDPTMGGVSASLAMLGDVNIAEPNALIGFAGPRVIEQTVREKLPEGFQRAEFLLEKGAIDMIITRHKLRDEIAELVAKMMNYVLVDNVYQEQGSSTKASNGNASKGANAALVSAAPVNEAEVIEISEEQPKSIAKTSSKKAKAAADSANDAEIVSEADDSESDNGETKPKRKRATTKSSAK